LSAAPCGGALALGSSGLLMSLLDFSNLASSR
jgi:hypothetical protein